MYKHDFFLETNLENNTRVESKEEDLHDIANYLNEAGLILTWQTDVQSQHENLVRFHLGVSSNHSDPNDILKHLKRAADQIDFFNVRLAEPQNNFLQM